MRTWCVYTSRLGAQRACLGYRSSVATARSRVPNGAPRGARSEASDNVTSMPYVLIVLFSLSDGSIGVMKTWQSFASPLTRSMQAFLENETAEDRTYVCVARARALTLAGATIESGQTEQ